ncbi:MAG TPA: SAM-dependent methyltransferase [Candidatus Omnitrophota bacterium]|nr:SAM-dependent methyltransferase [Candidatus Omnitrophota bacterium]
MDQKKILIAPLSSSFRDPAGFVFKASQGIQRAVTHYGRAYYDVLMQSPLYEELVQKKWLVAHREVKNEDGNFYKILEPKQIPVITYPHEWSFSQFKDAALLTLKIQLRAMDLGLSLRDATPYNIQFVGTDPIHIDTLSFEKLINQPWKAYKQFCEMFLAPLALMSERSLNFNKYMAVDLNGMDLLLSSRLLPCLSWLNPIYLIHLHLHALSQKKYADSSHDTKNISMSPQRLKMLIHGLFDGVQSIRLRNHKTEWSHYYESQTHYGEDAHNFKADQIKRWILDIAPKQTLDLGGNDGKFSRIASELGSYTLCVDLDANCIERNYLSSKTNGDRNMLPVFLDLSKPSPQIGWSCTERDSFFNRVAPDLTMALALIHHLRISLSVPLDLIALFFSKIKGYLIIEFVPKDDPMVQKLLLTREDIFWDYSEENFKKCFGQYFRFVEQVQIPGTNRNLCLLQSNS